MKRKEQFGIHIILYLALILVELSASVECLGVSSRRRVTLRRSDPVEPLIPVHTPKRPDVVNGTVECALSLAGRNLEVCELAWKMNQLQELLPHLQNLIINRLGKREFMFTVYMKQSSSTIQILDDAGHALLRSLGKFVQFLGYVQKLFNATVGGSQVLQEPLNNRRSMYQKAVEAAGFSEEIMDIDEVDDDQVQRLIKQAWSRKCALELLKSDKDLCQVINRINTLDELVVSHFQDQRSKDSQMLAIKLYSEKLNLIDILDAIHESLIRQIPVATQDSGTKEINDTDVIYLRSAGSRRMLINEHGEEVKEIFETPDYKVEFLRNDDKYTNGKLRRKVRQRMSTNARGFTQRQKPSWIRPSPVYMRAMPEAKIPKHGAEVDDTGATDPETEKVHGNENDYDFDWSYFDITSQEGKELFETDMNEDDTPKGTRMHSNV